MTGDIGHNGLDYDISVSRLFLLLDSLSKRKLYIDRIQEVIEKVILLDGKMFLLFPIHENVILVHFDRVTHWHFFLSWFLFHRFTGLCLPSLGNVLCK